MKKFVSSKILQEDRNQKYVDSLRKVIADTLGAETTLPPPASAKPAFSLPTSELLSKVEKEEKGLPGSGHPEEFVMVEAPAFIPLVEANAVQIASILTSLERDMFLRIEEIEYIDYLKTPQDYPSPNLSEFLRWTEAVPEWVAYQITSVFEKKARAEKIGFFLLIAKNCLDLHNFNSAFEVIGGLLQPCVQRLSKTWKNVLSSSKLKSIWAVSSSFSLSVSQSLANAYFLSLCLSKKELSTLSSPSSNYHEYLKELGKQTRQGKPVFPWIKIYLSGTFLFPFGLSYLKRERETLV